MNLSRGSSPIFKSLLFASGNRNKYLEVRRLFAPLGVPVLFGPDVASPPEVEESGRTYGSNALLKAKVWAEHTGRPSLADDSGLEVDALQGAPGLHSARIAPSDDGRIRWLLEAMKDCRERSACFVASFALYIPDTEVAVITEGECRGRISEDPRGSGGFGYDPLFIPAGHTETFAEMPPQVKESLSHRTIAGFRMIDVLSRKTMLE